MRIISEAINICRDRRGVKSMHRELTVILQGIPYWSLHFYTAVIPAKDLRHKFLLAQESNAEYLTEAVLPEGFEIINLSGHFFDMVAIVRQMTWYTLQTAFPAGRPWTNTRLDLSTMWVLIWKPLKW